MNVDPAAGPGPDETSPAPHVEPDRLADLAEGLLSRADAAAVRAHLGDCQACAADLALITESFDLAALLPAEPIPAEVVARVTAALEREPALGAATPASRTSAAPKTSGMTAPVSIRDGVAAARPRRRGFRIAFGSLGAAVALGALVVGGVAILRSPSGTEQSSGSSAAAPANGAAPKSPYATLAQVDDAATAQEEAKRLLLHPFAMPPSQQGESTGGSGLSGEAVRQDCVPAAFAQKPPLATQPVSFRGQPAVLLVYPSATDPTTADVIVVPQGCAAPSTAGSPSPVRPGTQPDVAVAPLVQTTIPLP